MSPRSDRASGSEPSKPPGLTSTEVSSPTPLTFTVTRADAALDLGVVQPLLGLGQLLLHLLGLLEQRVHVEATGAERLEGVLALGHRRASRCWSGEWFMSA